MKKSLLTAAVSSAALLFATAVYADGGPEAEPLPPEPIPEAEPAPVYEPATAPEYNWYTTIFAGAVFGDSLEIDVPVDYEVPMNTGYLVGWTLGYDNMFDGDVIQFRPEVEVSFRQQDVDLEQLIQDLGGPAVDLDPINLASDLLTVMGNLWIDFDMGGGFTPYVGGGIGYGWADTAIIESSDFVWQFGGGVNFDINDRVFAGIGYRYLGADFEEDITFIGPVTVEYGLRSHEVMASLGVRF